MTYLLLALAGAVVGGALAWLIAAGRTERRMTARVEEGERRVEIAEGRAAALEGTTTELRTQVERQGEELTAVRSRLAAEQTERAKAETQLSETVKRLQEEKQLLEEAKVRLTDTFKALAGDTLQGSTTAFLKLARETFEKILADARGDLGKRQEAIQGLVKPISESLKQFDEHVRSLEKHRQEAYAGLSEQLKAVSSTQQQLQSETVNLVAALRKPQVRGRWGEMTLKRVVELAGMVEHCDFEEQVSAESDDGRQRPDLIVRLPAGREIVVDAKVPLEAYLDALAAGSEEVRVEALSRHASQLRRHMTALADKRYWDQFPSAPEFVVMFIPGESFFGAAVDADTSLIEDGLKRHVVLATPTTLIALLRAVAYGWRQEQVARNAQEISELGRQLYERVKVFADHLADVGRNLERANGAYNKAVGSMETRVLPSARRFRELGAAGGDELEALPSVETSPRSLSAPDLFEGGR